MRILLFSLSLFCFVAQLTAAEIAGRVSDERGQILGYANLMLAGTRYGATADTAGRYLITNVTAGEYVLHVTLLGYEPWQQTIRVTDDSTSFITPVLREMVLPVDAVDIVAERENSGVASDRAVRTEIVAGAELQANATGGSVISGLEGETGVKTRPCALCGSCGVGMQGLDPSYTEISVDGMPLLAGVGTLYAIEGLSASDVTRLELVKGAASAEQGSGAIAGAVNLVTAQADSQTALSFGTSVSHLGQNTLTIAASRPVGNFAMRLSLLHSAEPNRLDGNDDGLTDTPKYNRLNLLYQIGSGGEDGWAVGVRAYRDRRFAGELAWSGDDRGSAAIYGREIITAREELTARYGLDVGAWEVKLRSAYVLHEQDSWYGTTEFDALQRLSVTELSAARPWNTRHNTLFQLSYQYQDYADNLALNTATDLSLSVPGLVVQHAWLLAPRWLLQLGNRAEYYAEDGVVLVPRTALRWQPATGTTLRATGGAGYRPVTIFSLEEAVEAGFDRVVLSDDLAAERSQSYSLGLNRAWSFNAQTLSLDLAAFYTNFDRKVVVQLGETAGEAHYRMAHAAFSRSAELQARWTHEQGWRLKAGATRSDVRYRIDGQTHNAELQYAWTGDAAVGKAWRQGWDAELAASVFGPQFLPAGRARATSPAYVLWDAELRKNWGAFSTSLIVRNLFDWTQSDNPYQRDPHSGRLVPDAALFYGPVLGRTVHVGFNYSL